ncbi:MAG: hypothetical protein ACTILK_06650 [Bifidobacterium crudilactis]
MTVTSSDGYGLRPALRLRLDNLLLSGNKGNQGQSVSGDLRLTFVDTAARVVLSKTPRLEKNGANWELTDVDGTVNGFTKTGFGWKLIDPEDDSGEVVASGRTNKDTATNTDGNMVVPCASLMPVRITRCQCGGRGMVLPQRVGRIVRRYRCRAW